MRELTGSFLKTMFLCRNRIWIGLTNAIATLVRGVEEKAEFVGISPSRLDQILDFFVLRCTPKLNHFTAGMIARVPASRLGCYPNKFRR